MTRRRRVLLDDEDACADATRRELLVALDRDPFDLDILDARPVRAAAQEGRELVERRRGALGMNLSAAVLAEAHPAGQLELACSRDGCRADLLGL